MGVIASDDVTGVHLLPKVLFDAALPRQRPPPGQQRPQAPAGTEPGAGAALGRGVSGAGSQLLVTPAVQATVRAPGGPAAGPAASVFENGVLGVGAGRGAPGLRREPGAGRRLVRGAGPEAPGLPGRGGVPYALPEPQLAALRVLLRHFRDTAQPLRARALRGALWLLAGRCFGAPTVMALLGERVTRGRTARERGSVTWAGGRENTALVSAAVRGWRRRAARPERGHRPCGTRGPHRRASRGRGARLWGTPAPRARRLKPAAHWLRPDSRRAAAAGCPCDEASQQPLPALVGVLALPRDPSLACCSVSPLALAYCV